jgi:hypothetical protein
VLQSIGIKAFVRLNVHMACMPQLFTNLTVGHHKPADSTKGGGLAMAPNNTGSIFKKYMRKLKHSENKTQVSNYHLDGAKAEETEFDQFRKKEYSRLDDEGIVYLDYAGAALYPKSLLAKHCKFLENHTLGNPHSGSPA